MANKKSIADNIAGLVQKETGGPVANAGFSFQKNFAIVTMLEMFTEQDDFVVIFDCHEDTIILDKKENPTYSKFYQIKQKSKGNWTSGSFIKQKNNSSILGKLMSPSVDFTAENISYFFISDAPAKLYRDSIKQGGKTIKQHTENFSEIRMSDLKSSEFNKIKKSIEEELNVDFDQILDKLTIKKIDLPVIGGETFCVGKVNEFLIKHFGGECSFRPDLFYSTIFSIIDSKTNFKSETRTAENLFKFKCISKEEFGDYLNSSNSVISPLKNWPMIESKLNKLKIPPLRVRKMKNYWETFNIDLMSSKEIVLQIQKRIIDLLDEFAVENEDANLDEILSSVLASYLAERIEQIYSNDELKVIILNEIN